MKRHVIIVVLAVTIVFAGLQAAPSRADTDLDRGNAVPGEALPEELQALDIKDYYVASGVVPVGLIRTVTGHVVVLNGDTGEAYFAAPGDAVFRQDALFTLEESRCRIKFTTADVITMGEDTRIDINEFVDDRELQKKKSTFSMLKGKAMFYVIPLFRYKEVSFTVKTQTAVMGVRGTKFGVEVAFLDFAQLDASDVETMVYGFEGAVEVYSHIDGATQMVGEGENLLVSCLGTGSVQDMDPGMAEQFMSDTEAPAPEGDEGVEVQAQPAEEEAAEEEGGDADSAVTTDTGGDIVDVTQNQTTITVEGTVDQRPTKHFGYFTGMLTMDDYGTKSFKHLYLSDSLQDFDSDSIEGRDLLAGGLNLVADGSQDYDDPRISSIDVDTPYTITGSFPIVHGELGHNAYIEWGYWTQPIAMSDDTNNYYFDNRGYYIFGDHTTDARMCDLALNNVSGTYSGAAHGTYWTAGGGANMLGDFRANVNFASASISNFKVDVSGGGHSVLIDGASGGFSGSQFQIMPSTGTWKIDGTKTTIDDYKEARGSVYGPNGEAIGGVWKLDKDDESGHATGMFQGTR
ncbi:MAG: FecR domain-containing protein [Deltaproteobacteria bacterium]|nr:FecR domain-containing protein [Deltaproteobacteria bacterium]MBW1794298.1 FecR domain-containing protein [Deltaproteobacteria bacterium]